MGGREGGRERGTVGVKEGEGKKSEREGGKKRQKGREGGKKRGREE